MSPQSLILSLLLIISQFNNGTGFTKKGAKLGESCGRERDCVGEHVMCNKSFNICQCQTDYHMQIVTQKGTLCGKATKLGEECLSTEVCIAHDENTECQQHGHQAICMCKLDFHKIYDKTQGKDRCVQETQLLNSDLVTLLIVGTAMVLFCGLTCLVLRIFARARFGPHGGNLYANAQQGLPAVTLSTEQECVTGEPRGSHLNSRNSSQRNSLAESTRRQSGSLLAPPTRQGDGGSRRASNSSIRSSSSSRSQRSYSMRNPVGHQNHQQLHPNLQHRPSDPETRSQQSQNSQMNLSVKDNVSGGSIPSVTFNLPSHISDTSTSSHSHTKKAKRSGSAGTLPEV